MAKGKKTGGRQKGTPNKATAFTKEVISDILSDYYSTGQMAEDMKALEPKERVDAIIKLAAFVTPKPQSIDMSITASKQKTIEDTLDELSQENEEL